MKNSPIPIPGLAPEGGVTIVDGSGEKSFKISDYRGRYVVILFYSGDWECRENILAFQNIIKKYQDAKCSVFACSSDSAKVHQNWIRTSTADGGFGGSILIPLISDCSGAMSQKYDVYDSEEGVCRNAVVIIDESGIVRHAMTTSMEHDETARNCLDIIAMLKQHQLSDSEVRNINSSAKGSAKSRSASKHRAREMSPVAMDRAALERVWDVSDDPELNKVLNIAKMLGKAVPKPIAETKKDPTFEVSVETIRRLINPAASSVRGIRATLQRNLAAFAAQNLTRNQKLQIESLVEKMMGVAYMPEGITGQYHRMYTLNQREQTRFFDQDVFLNSGDIRLRDPGTVKWAEGSGVFVNNYSNLLMFVNYKDALRITSAESGTDIRSVLLRLRKSATCIEEAVKSLSKKGFLSKDNKFVHSEVGVFGHGFDLSFIADYPGYAKEGDKILKSTGIKYGLTVQKYGRKDGLYEVRVSQRAEDDILKIVKRGISGIDALGKEEEKLKKKHNITIHDFEDSELTRGY